MGKLVEAKRLADEWQDLAERARREAEVAMHFSHLSPHELIALWQSEKKLSPFEVEALVERWLAVFEDWPPFDDDDSDDTAPPEPASAEPELPDDDSMLRAKDVVRLTGVSLATIKRMVLDGRFPKPCRLSPRQIGWPARDVRAFIDGLDGSRRKMRS